jgi:hypothetical protein
VTVAAGDRGRLDRLCRYAFRPPLGQHRLQRLLDGRIAVALQREWTDGTTHLAFTPQELLERLATLVPRPRINLPLYHGILAPNAAWRRAIVPAEPSTVTEKPRDDLESLQPIQPQRRARPKYRASADLMRPGHTSGRR